jgi:hypothetical protein
MSAHECKQCDTKNEETPKNGDVFDIIGRDVNETLGSETETFGFLPKTRPRRYHPKIFRDRDETETFAIGSRRDRDLNSEAETETFFRDPLIRLTVSL